MNQEEIESIKIIMEKGKRSLSSAERSIEEGDYDFASSRAYYAVFYFMQAVLSTKGMTFSKHSASIAEFGKSFIKTGVFPKEYGKRNM
ncbi:MAG: HEPN domain-containing protein [Candidatus Poribacteria bacterium]